ncbi:putative MFS transporter [Actinoplanes missouriensis 431]|uniref:Putative MFS transporter n=1 Tax=Actinoplanes missouriensis (strain ATCC 14538 / DSM 43046 / CBS 188.64 / JCM 3121 / NBRC 102363 / NCIMB 12654 / NRRL B-3342 / UNCC 431) TaxID=512565 RepID=I0H248_ACTM4|nr:MFS transporter [Actinoplanes missouriensis]BAL87085.1 putative MFS transporter [Actinoplanes missouriensis 431]
MSPWRAITAFGLVSLAADMVYEGARSITGPLLGTLGASALVVGLITGAGEAAALLLRLVSGPLADRTARYWTLTIAGYGLTALCVPLLAVAPALGGAGLAVAGLLIVAERVGKAIRSPAKSALLAEAAGQVGRGRGFAVHKALDQIGAFAGPLLVAALVAAFTLPAALAALAIPGALAMALLFWLRPRFPAPDGRDTAIVSGRLPRRFYLFALAMAASTAGLVTFGLISYHASESGGLPLATVPLLYAAAMAAGAVAALLSGHLYDRWGPRVLYALPALAAAMPALAFAGSMPAIVAGTLLWGAAVGVQDSTVKALVADLVAAPRRATAYGVFAAIQGAAALGGGVLAGALYGYSITLLAVVLAVLQGVAAVLLAVTRA